MGRVGLWGSRCKGKHKRLRPFWSAYYPLMWAVGVTDNTVALDGSQYRRYGFESLTVHIFMGDMIAGAIGGL